jgi:hypothetical protein
MRLGHVTFERELVEQSVLLDFPIPHHRLPPSRHDFRKSDYYTMTDPVFFNTIGGQRTFVLRSFEVEPTCQMRWNCDPLIHLPQHSVPCQRITVWELF